MANALDTRSSRDNFSRTLRAPYKLSESSLSTCHNPQILFHSQYMPTPTRRGIFWCHARFTTPCYLEFPPLPKRRRSFSIHLSSSVAIYSRRMLDLKPKSTGASYPLAQRATVMISYRMQEKQTIIPLEFIIIVFFRSSVLPPLQFLLNVIRRLLSSLLNAILAFGGTLCCGIASLLTRL